MKRVKDFFDKYLAEISVILLTIAIVANSVVATIQLVNQRYISLVFSILLIVYCGISLYEILKKTKWDDIANRQEVVERLFSVHRTLHYHETIAMCFGALREKQFLVASETKDGFQIVMHDYSLLEPEEWGVNFTATRKTGESDWSVTNFQGELVDFSGYNKQHVNLTLEALYSEIEEKYGVTIS